MKKIDFSKWPQSYLLSNGSVELIVPSLLGPRILSLAVAGGTNLFHVEEGDSTSLNRLGCGGHWLRYGTAEEPEENFTDESPVGVEITKGQVRLRQKKEEPGKIIREIDIHLFKGSPRIEIIHRVHNHNAWAISMYAWSHTIFPLGGFAAFLFKDPVAERTMNTPPSTDLGDKRFQFDRTHLVTHALAKVDKPLKISTGMAEDYALYWRNGCLFASLAHPTRSSLSPVLGTVCIHSNCLEICSRWTTPILASGASFEFREDWLVIPIANNPLQTCSSVSDITALLSSHLKVS